MNSRQQTQQPAKRAIPAFLILTTAGLLAILGLILTAVSTRAAQDATLGLIAVNLFVDQFGSDTGACSLREAVTTANLNANFGGCIGGGSADTIELETGTYVLSFGGGGEDFNQAGDLDVTTSMTITGHGPALTSIEAGASFTDRLMHIGPNATVVISGVRLAGADVQHSAPGAAILVEGNLTLINCVIEDNTTVSIGGAIHVTAIGRLTINNCHIQNNRAVNRGGGIVAGGSLTVTDSTISGNDLNDAGSFGGGIAVEGTSNLTLIRTTISGNSALGSGGGLVLASAARTSIIDSTIRGNSAPESGGIWHVKGSLLMVNSAILSNTSISASGMRVTNTLAILVNSTVSGNVAQAGAGGIAVNSANGRLYLYNTTIANNTTNAGASGGNGGGLAIQAGSTVSMTGSVLANNIDLGASGDTPDCSGTIHLVAYNHVENTAGCTITGPATGNVTGSDPNLRALTNNGGPTLTHLPNAGSPLVDSGDPAGCSGPDGDILNTDQRGFFRPVNGGSALRCDKGSAERGSFQMRLAMPMIAR